MATWKMMDKFVRRVTKNTGNSKQINVPKRILDIIGASEIQFVLMNNEQGQNLVALCGLDDFNNLMKVINKDGE